MTRIVRPRTRAKLQASLDTTSATDRLVQAVAAACPVHAYAPARDLPERITDEIRSSFPAHRVELIRTLSPDLEADRFFVITPEQPVGELLVAWRSGRRGHFTGIAFDPDGDLKLQKVMLFIS